MYRIPEMPRPGLAFAQSFTQGLQLGTTMRQLEEQRKERDEERRQKAITNLINLAYKTKDFDAINKLGRAGFGELWVDIEPPTIGGTTETEYVSGGPEGDIVPKEVRKGGVQVPEKIKQLLEGYAPAKEMAIKADLPGEALLKMWTGWEKATPQQKTAMLQEYEVWGLEPENVEGSFIQFLGERTDALARGKPRTGILAVWDEYKKENPKATFSRFLSIYPKRAGRAMQLYERLAKGMYGKLYYKLKPEEKMAVEDEVTKRQKQTGLGAIFGQIFGGEMSEGISKKTSSRLTPEEEDRLNELRNKRKTGKITETEMEEFLTLIDLL